MARVVVTLYMIPEEIDFLEMTSVPRGAGIDCNLIPKWYPGGLLLGGFSPTVIINRQPASTERMTLLVPFDGSDLSIAALERASEFADYRGEDVVAVTVVPNDEKFAVERGWIDEDEPLDIARICDEFEQQVHEVNQDVTFKCEQPKEGYAISASAIDDISRTIRSLTEELDVSIVFIGSENAGRISTSVHSVGSPISEDPRYDVHIVRHVE